MVSPQISHRKKWREVDLSRHRLTRSDVKGGLGRRASQRREQAAFAGVNLKPEPRLAVLVLQVDVASGQVRDLDRGDDGLVGDVLEPFELQLHLDLGVAGRRRQERPSQEYAEHHRRQE